MFVAAPPSIISDSNVRTSRVSTIYSSEIKGSYTTWKMPVKLATTENIVLSGLQTIDGMELSNGDRVLVKNQNVASENGIYVVENSEWFRSDDLSNGSSAANMITVVNEGSVNDSLTFMCVNDMGSDIVGTDNLVFTEYASGGGGGENVSSWKMPVRVATTENIVLSSLQTIDYVELNNGDRILVKNQDNLVENGIYIAGNSVWSRSDDLSNGSSAANIITVVNEGNNSSLTFMCINFIGSDVVGTDELEFIEYATGGSAAQPANSIQFNSGGNFTGSNYLKFDPTIIPKDETNNFNIYGTTTIGKSATETDTVGLITCPYSNNQNGCSVLIRGGQSNSTYGGNALLYGGTNNVGTGGNVHCSGGTGYLGGQAILSGGDATDYYSAGGNVNIYGGDGGNGGNGGNVIINAGHSRAGTGGSVSISAGTGNTRGDVNIYYTYMRFYDNDYTVLFLNGGMRFEKSSATIANLTAPPTVTPNLPTLRQGIITITDPSALTSNTSITITVNYPAIKSFENVIVSIQKFTVGSGIPHISVSSITQDVGFTIQLYNIGSTAFAASAMEILFMIV